VDIQRVEKYLPLLASGKLSEKPLVVVTPDGRWWDGRINECSIKEDWHEQVLDLLEKHQDCVAVACDVEDWYGY
jgi:hypothetical protein